MSTGELERLERRLTAALHEADDRPVDVAAGRAELRSPARIGSSSSAAGGPWRVSPRRSCRHRDHVAGAGEPSGRQRGPAGRTAQAHPVALRPAGGVCWRPARSSARMWSGRRAVDAGRAGPSRRSRSSLTDCAVMTSAAAGTIAESSAAAPRGGYESRELDHAGRRTADFDRSPSSSGLA